MGNIKHMPEELHSSVRSGIIVYDLTRVIEELVFNSLDAGANKVHVALDVSTCYVKVKDNGSGISRDGLVLVGQRYATSKHGHLGDASSTNGSFGFRGEALCSISDVALLEIITRTHGMPNGYRKVIKGCKCLYLGISDEIFDVGTTVVVRDLFYNQPVRRKHIQSSSKKVLHSVKSGILRIALVHPRILFRVIDVESENEVLSTGPSSSPLPLLTSGFGIDTNTSFRELNISDGILNLSGYVSGPCDIIPSKVFQYIYINSRFVCKGPIHKLINQLALRFVCIDDWKPESSLHSVKQSHPQLCPSFLLNLICKRLLYDITFEPSRTTVEFKDWGAVLTFIENAVSKFWSESEPHALSLKNDSGKKRFRIQEDKGSLLLPTSPPKKLNLNHTSVPSWGDCRDSFEKYVGDASDFGDHVTGDICFDQVDCSRKSHDRPQICLGDVIRAENDFGKKRSRIQEDEGSLQLLTSPPKKLNLNHTSLPSWGDCRYSFEKYDATDFGDHVNEDGCFNQVDCSRKSHDGPQIYLGDAIDAENDFRKKRCRIQEDEGSLQLLTSPPRKHNLDHTSLPSWGNCQDLFEKYVGDASDFDDHIPDDGCFSQADCPLKSYDRPKVYIGDVIGAENTDDLQSSHCSYISNGDVFSEHGLFSPERPFKLVKCNKLTWEEPTTIEARIGDISKESFECRTFSDNIRHMTENEQPFLSGLSGQPLLGHESSFEGEDAFKLRTDGFRTKHKWDVHDDGLGTGGLENLGKTSSDRSSEQGHLPSTRSFLSSRIQHSKKIYDDCFSENQRNPFLTPSMDEDYEYCHLPSDLGKPMRETFDSDLSPIPSDPSYGARLHADFCSVEDGGGTPFKSDQILSDGYSDVTGKGYYSGFNVLGEIAQENYGSSRFSVQDVYSRNNFWEQGDNYIKSDIINETGQISSQTTVNETRTNYHVAGNHPSSIDYERNVYGSHIRRQGMQSDSRKRATRCHSAPPIYRRRKRFLAVGDLYMLSEVKPNSPVFHDKTFLPGFRAKQTQHYSKSIRWRCSPQSPTQSHLLSVGNPATVTSDVYTSSGVQDYELHGKDNDTNACNYDSQEECKLKSRERLFDYETNQQDTLLKSAGRNMSFKNEHEASILDISSGILHLSGDSLVPNSLDKSFLERAIVLQQVDKKYIPVVGCKILAIIDQHAADERIRLEELRKQVLSGEMKTITYLETEQDLVLPEIGFQLLHDYAEKIQSWGWICNIQSQNSESFTKNMKILHSHPNVTRLLAVPCILGVNLTDGDMLEYLQQLADTDGSSTMPPAVNRILNNKACRGAIMFGDALLPSECSLIVEELKRTSLCFQCAHGRPTTVPLVNMDALHKHIAKLRLASESSDGSWHGLHRHKISVERASQRIS